MSWGDGHMTPETTDYFITDWPDVHYEFVHYKEHMALPVLQEIHFDWSGVAVLFVAMLGFVGLAFVFGWSERGTCLSCKKDRLDNE